MSVIEYNDLLFKVSQRLNELNVGKRLLVMCRGKVAPRSEEHLPDVFQLFLELEEKEYLGSDRLGVLKDVLGGLEEWSLLENVEQFETKRKEYHGLLEQIIQALDELNDVEQLVSICKGKISEERQGNIRDVRSLFEELKNNGCLEINCFDILKEIFIRTDKRDLLEKVEEFEERRNRENKSERRKARAIAIASSASANLTGVLNIKTVFKVAAGGIVIASAFELLRRGSTYDQLVNAITTCVLPAGAKLVQITEGSVNLKVQAEHISALDTLWSLYKDGTLKERLEYLFITNKVTGIAGGEQVEVTVTIDEQEYKKARKELSMEAQRGPADEREEWQEKLAYIQSYLEQSKDSDSHSVTTETSDSGMAESRVAPSEFGMGETSDSIFNLCLKDVSKAVTSELTCRLRTDPFALQRFYQSFGLDPVKLLPESLEEFFPDTPIKLLRDVFDELQLYDLVELLEKVKPRTLRPVFPLKEIRKALNATNRPTKFYSKAEVLIIKFSESVAADYNVLSFRSFLKALNPESNITTVTSGNLAERLGTLKETKKMVEDEDRRASTKETKLKELLDKRVPFSWYKHKSPRLTLTVGRNSNEHLLKVFYKEEQEMRKELENVTKQREQWTKEIKPKIEKEIKQKEEELQRENEKFQMAVCDVMDNWICQASDEGEESTLYVVLFMENLTIRYDEVRELLKTTRECLREKFASIPNTKLVISSNTWSSWGDGNIPQETLEVRFGESERNLILGLIVELLDNRWQTLDLISVFREVQRTVSIKNPQHQHFNGRFFWSDSCTYFDIFENLSCLPKLQKTEQVSKN